MKITTKDFSLISNTKYLLSLQWTHSRISLVFLLLLIPLTVSISFINVYLPKMAVSQIVSAVPYTQIAVSFVLMGVLLVAANSFKKALEEMNFAYMTKFRREMTFRKLKKVLSTNYQNLKTAACRTLMQRSDEALWNSGNGCPAEQITKEFSEIITNFILFLLFGSLLASLNIWVAIALIGTSLISFWFMKKVQTLKHKTRKETAVLEQKLWYIANSASDFSASKDIRLYRMKSWMLTLFRNYTAKRLQREKYFAKKIFGVHVIDVFIVLARDGFAYAILIYLVLTQKITIDYFILYFGSIATFASSIGEITSKLSHMNELNSVINDLRNFLEFPESKNGTKLLDEINTKTCSISIKNLQFSYQENKQNILRNINLEIAAGSKVAIVGLNGAGKTTLIKTLTGLYTPSSGKICINGIDQAEFIKTEYYKLFSAVFQDIHLLPITISSFISGSLTKTDQTKMIDCLKQADLYEDIQNLRDGINTKLNRQLNKDGIELSGGQQQKLLLARALYQDAKILILDEPTAALDPIAEDKIYQQYDSLTKGKTSIFVSHRLASTLFCDRILFLENGEIVEDGTHQELIEKQGKYAKLFQLQSQYYTH